MRGQTGKLDIEHRRAVWRALAVGIRSRRDTRCSEDETPSGEDPNAAGKCWAPTTR